MHWRLWVAALAVAVSAQASLAGDFPVVAFAPDVNGAVTFSTPSNNIECIFIPKGGTKVYEPEGGGPELSCDRLKPTYMRFILGPKGGAKSISNLGEQPCCSGNNPLPYGSSWRGGPFLCESTASGLSCERDDAHGFFISQSSVKIY